MSSEQTSLSSFIEFDQLTEFDSDMIKLFLSKTASSPDERLRILLVAITVMWSLCHARNTISANLANLIDRICFSWRLAQATTGRITNHCWLCYRSSCTIKETMSEFLATV